MNGGMKRVRKAGSAEYSKWVIKRSKECVIRKSSVKFSRRENHSTSHQPVHNTTPHHTTSHHINLHSTPHHTHFTCKIPIGNFSVGSVVSHNRKSL